LLVRYDATLKRPRRSAQSLTKYAVENRYPAMWATARQMKSALHIAERIRRDLRVRLGLSA
jgi:hypothetical protein